MIIIIQFIVKEYFLPIYLLQISEIKNLIIYLINIIQQMKDINKYINLDFIQKEYFSLQKKIIQI